MKWQLLVTYKIRLTDSSITAELGYKHTFCQNVVLTIFAFPYIFVET